MNNMGGMPMKSEPAKHEMQSDHHKMNDMSGMEMKPEAVKAEAKHEMKSDHHKMNDMSGMEMKPEAVKAEAKHEMQSDHYKMNKMGGMPMKSEPAKHEMPSGHYKMNKMSGMAMKHQTVKHGMQMEHHKMKHKMKHKMPSDKESFSYDLLRSPVKTNFPESRTIKEIKLDVTGNMWRYIWHFNGKTLSEVDYIKIKRGEVARITLNNKTMMNHPLHLHGHFFRVLNKNGEYSPLKHTVDVPPMKVITIEFDAVESGDWFFHCHVLYHMSAGMARVFSYGTKRDPRLKKYPVSKFLNKDKEWFTWTDIVGASHFGAVALTSSNTRNQINLEVEYGWNENFESEASYERYLSDYFRVYAGSESENETKDHLDIKTVGTLGIRYLLPYFIDMDFRVDTDLRLQLAFGLEILIFPRVGVFGFWEWENDFGWINTLPTGTSWVRDYTWDAGLEFILTRQLSLITSYDNRFGVGGGLLLLW